MGIVKSTVQSASTCREKVPDQEQEQKQPVRIASESFVVVLREENLDRSLLRRSKIQCGAERPCKSCVRKDIPCEPQPCSCSSMGASTRPCPTCRAEGRSQRPVMIRGRMIHGENRGMNYAIETCSLFIFMPLEVPAAFQTQLDTLHLLLVLRSRETPSKPTQIRRKKPGPVALILERGISPCTSRTNRLTFFSHRADLILYALLKK